MIKYKQAMRMVVVFASMTGFMWAQAHNLSQATKISQDHFLIDAERSQVDFAVNHLEFMTIRGAFTEYDATLRMAGMDWTTLELHATIDTASIYTGRGILDDNLRSVDFFDVVTYPQITFSSLTVEPHGTEYLMSGLLTMKGVTQEVILTLAILDTVTDARGHTRMQIRLSGELNRQTYGVSQGGMPDRLINDIVRLDVRLEAIRQ